MNDELELAEMSMRYCGNAINGPQPTEEYVAMAITLYHSESFRSNVQGTAEYEVLSEGRKSRW